MIDHSSTLQTNEQIVTTFRSWIRRFEGLLSSLRGVTPNTGCARPLATIDIPIFQVFSDQLVQSSTPAGSLCLSLLGLLDEVIDRGGDPSSMTHIFEELTWTAAGVYSPIGVETRLAIWERVIAQVSDELTLFRSDEQVREGKGHLLHISRLFWSHSLNKAEEVYSIVSSLRTDPHWRSSHVRARKSDYRAERQLVELINTSHQVNGIIASLAPLEADLLHGLDISVRRKSPRASAWLQFSLSAENKLNQHKLIQLKKSAAVALLSPWTLHEFLMQREDVQESSRLFSHDRPHTAIARARSIGETLLLLLQGSYSSELEPACRELEVLIAQFISSVLGKPASRRYRPKKRALVNEEALKLLRQLLSREKG